MRVLKLFLAVLTAACLSACMAVPLLPIAFGATDKPTSDRYTTSAKRPAVFNAALKAVQVKGRTESIDRETGSIKGHIIIGATAYAVTIFVEEASGKTTLRIDVANSLYGKFDLKNSGEISKEVVQETERQLGSRLEKTSA